MEFVPTEVGTHIVEVTVNGDKLPSGPLIAKVYDAGLIQVADVSGGVVGQPVQFRGILYNLEGFKMLPEAFIFLLGISRFSFRRYQLIFKLP